MLISEETDNQVIHGLIRDSSGKSQQDTDDLEEYRKSLASAQTGSDMTRAFLKLDQTRVALGQRYFDRQEAIGQREKRKSNTSDTMFSYLSDRSLLKHWVDRFSGINKELSRELAEYSYSHYVQREGEMIHQSRQFSGMYEEMSANYDALIANLGNCGGCLPVEVEMGIVERMRTLESFLDSIQYTISVGYGDTPKANKLKEIGDVNPLLRQRKVNRSAENGVANDPSPISRQDLPGWIGGIVVMLATAFQVAAFVKAAPDSSPGSAIEPDFFSASQQVVWSFLGLYLTIIPALGTHHFGQSFGFWTWTFAGTSAFFAAASLVFYVTISPAACAIAVFAANASQAFVVFQLIQGISKISSKVKTG
ncbi:hypothetical protein IFR05_007147 [Cadophora sp. M221]|nr:hypothetical protein IFR05_007147 [Cadophora sp. M221]